MGKGKRHRERGGHGATDWSVERTLADAEADAAVEAEPLASRDASMPAASDVPGNVERAQSTSSLEVGSGSAPGARCACGSDEFLLEAYLAVVRGRPQPEPVELESLTCPQCGREYEAIWLADGRVARGEFRGQTDLEE